ncbi:MAG: DUF4011 domain-containing protein [Burkholderiales bacterium]|nr:DUF4011 domain-containing protein [Burkholderiales bacterium]
MDMHDTAGMAEEKTITLEAKVESTVSYASYQNHVPVVRSLSITNHSESPLLHIQVAIKCEPAFAEPLTIRFDRLDPHETRRIDPVDIKLNHKYLAELNEAEHGRIVTQAVAHDIHLSQADFPVEVLAYDQWAGTRALPELLAAFSLPNNPVIDRLIHQASDLLVKSGHDQSMNGYQSKNRDDVWLQISAIYSAIGSLNLHYSMPPASFGSDGQKIRTPDRVLSGGVATCLDSTMLLSSCFEQAGLNPIVLIKKGHAWIGCWLVNTTLSTSILDDAQAIRKRVASGELLVIETTLLSQRPIATLKVACERGVEHLHQEEDFLFALDIRRARQEQIRPLPFRSQADGQLEQPLAQAEPAIETPPALPPLEENVVTLDEDKPAETPEGRLTRWKSKLLDLTLRNRLINFKPTKLMLPLRVPDPCGLEDSLSDGKEWKFRPAPQIMEGTDPREASVAKRRTGEDPIEAAASKAMQMHELLAAVDEKKLESHLYEIYSATRLGLEEGGANTLYLALGFLRWAEDQRAEKTLLAPILLVPVTLTRQSVRAGYCIKRHDDETIVNPTLVQLLRERFQLSIKGIDPLPTDESGVDVAKVWQLFRLAINDIPRWEVIEDVYLGIFSFTKYLMWKDLQDRADQLKKNRVVNHLIERPREAIGAAEDLWTREDMDERHGPEDLLTPLLADSSQLNAVSRADAGHDFALEGPPGTGKSQTITNLIAHFLGQGRSVLFVSEKMAALDVVHRRLNGIGLGPFCLQLHSAKAKKSEVLDQLRATLDVVKAHTQDEWKREAERLQVLRTDLNSLVRTLHHTYPNGLTVRSATDCAIQGKHWRPARMPWINPNTHNRAALDQLRELTRSIQSVAGELSSVKGHPLALVGYTEWSNGWEDQFVTAVRKLNDAGARLQEASLTLESVLGLSLSAASQALQEAVNGLIDVLLHAPLIPIELARHAGDAKIRKSITRLREYGERRQANWQILAKLDFKPDVARANGEELIQLWGMATTTWWPKKWFDQRSITGRLSIYRNQQTRPSNNDVPALLAALAMVNQEDKVLAASASQAEEVLGKLYRGADTDWSAVERHEKWMEQVENALARFSAVDNGKDVNQLTENLRSLVTAQRAGLTAQGPLAIQLTAFRTALVSFNQLLGEAAQLAASDADFIGDAHSAGRVPRIGSILAAWQAEYRSLRTWCRWRNLRAKAMQAGLSSAIESLEAGSIDIQDFVTYTEYSYQVWWLKAITDQEPVLRSFSSADHERKIREFQESDARFQKLTEQYITAILAAKVPRQIPGQKPDAEMALVLRELAKQRAHLPVRKLVQGIPTLLPKLKPCLLMSPISVAQYLDAAHSSFDVVVFDEASQIPVWDAVGAIARGKQLVVVGDPKQLPPTNFFTRSDDEEDAGLGEGDGMLVKDLESILDECLGAGLPALRLEWHYRSRHESLITFSNHRYYDSRLITFPSPVTKDVAVKLEMVGGIYDRGGTRTNRAEADAIVQAIVRHFTDESSRKFTMGVVTFNQTQQRLIEILLDEELRKSPELEQRIAEHGSERLFIKNLENVQGDERDLILFSIAYGKDAAGKMPMNFGPLNKEGGHRRLNVAITRARVGVTIYCSIRPEDIDLSRTRASGVLDLKNYLEFAQRGVQAIVEQALPTGREPDSPFEMEVIQALRDKGWTVHPQIGCSGYRVDIGVVHPEQPGTYLLGVECDGATYHSLPTARDRDRLRQIILEGLGWTLHRIWSTDWWADPKREIQKLEDALERRLSAMHSTA